MNNTTGKWLFWTPRAICILFAVFTSLFALDVFTEHSGFWTILLALLIHLIPTYIIVAVLVVSWRREAIGGYLFISLGILYLLMAIGKFPWYVYLAISGPLFLVGILFLLNWRYREQLRSSAESS